MTSLTETMAKDRRRAILEHLAMADAQALGVGVIAALMVDQRHGVYRDLVTADVDYLRQHGLVTIADYPSAAGPQMEARLTGLGADVAAGRPHPAVAAKLADY